MTLDTSKIYRLICVTEDGRHDPYFEGRYHHTAPDGQVVLKDLNSGAAWITTVDDILEYWEASV